ncbi:hypothetical protein GCM10009584_21560 [Ornithinimicrobium humiphilum]|uniref:Uncharacterized protein n=1 Tax=Ornithinimicrobium humiphilum TaxID=125288 RepID=A0A543KNA4_9MICO|nr:hypothetical protein [Ornithinimicrobium humiphilum]TQM96549.1 hypothetical protein FB476_1418 [Ornithinimicrobium humiphilum]
MEEFDLDRTTEVGWAAFLSRLADHLGTAREPLVMTPMGGEDDHLPVLEVTPGAGGDDALLHAELRGPGEDPWPEEARTRHLLSLGWTPAPGGTAYLLDLPRSHAHLLAAVVTDTLRDVVGVPHPAFLDAGALTIAAPTEAEPEEPAPPPQVDLDTAVMVRTPAELRELVDTTLHAALGHPPRHDHDGDVPILYGSALVYVRTADAAPVVTVFAIPVQDIGDLEAARREVEIFNRRAIFGKFTLVGRQIVASVAVPCLPFVPRHLVGMVELMGREIDQLDEDLALRVQGRRWIDLVSGTGPAGAPPTQPVVRAVDVAPPAAPEAEPPAELQTLVQLQLDAEGGDLEPALVADVCHRDRDLILRLIRMAEDQTLRWRSGVGRARAAGDADGARSAGDQVRAWARTVRNLRAALRHVVTFGGSAEG